MNVPNPVIRQVEGSNDTANCNGVIYKAVSPSGKIYIGQTVYKLSKRVKIHEYLSIKNKNYMANAIKKYGINNFSWEIIDYYDSRDNADFLERKYIKLYKSNIPEFGYNLTNGGLGANGYLHTEESKAKKRGDKNPNYKNGFKIAGNKNCMKNPITRQKHLLSVNTIKYKEKMSKLMKGVLAGEKNPLTSLTEKDVLNIRALGNTNLITHQSIANIYNVTRECITRITNYKSWKYVA